MHDWLNAAGGGRPTYLAIASNYEPTERGLLDFAKDRLTDALFGEGNDLVVPTDGVFCHNGAGSFPIDEPFVLSASSGTSATRATSPRARAAKLLDGYTAERPCLSQQLSARIYACRQAPGQRASCFSWSSRYGDSACQGLGGDPEVMYR